MGAYSIDAPYSFQGGFVLVSMAVLREVGFWPNDSVVEDADLSLRIYCAGYRGVYLSDVRIFSEDPSSLEVWKKQAARVAQGWANCAIANGRKILSLEENRPLLDPGRTLPGTQLDSRNLRIGLRTHLRVDRSLKLDLLEPDLHHRRHIACGHFLRFRHLRASYSKNNDPAKSSATSSALLHELLHDDRDHDRIPERNERKDRLLLQNTETRPCSRFEQAISSRGSS